MAPEVCIKVKFVAEVLKVLPLEVFNCMVDLAPGIWTLGGDYCALRTFLHILL
jgi:hypothetical protein